MTRPFYVDPITLDDLAEPFPDEELPWLDRVAPNSDPYTITARWHREGYVILPGFIEDDVLDRYCWAWKADNGPKQTKTDDRKNRPMGWPYNTPYMHVPELRDLCCHRGLAQMLHALIGEPMGVHLNLSGWRSTTRNWHQDGYLNPDHVADWYAAVWVALDDIHPDSGPFEFIPGSHRVFPPIRQAAMRAMLTDEEQGPDWPAHTERILTPMFEDLMAEHEMQPRQFIARRGDVLIWHARLLHRGSTPKDPKLERRSIISHYSGISHRPDMPAPAMQHSTGGWYFPIDEGGHG